MHPLLLLVVVETCLDTSPASSSRRRVVVASRLRTCKTVCRKKLVENIYIKKRRNIPGTRDVLRLESRSSSSSSKLRLRLRLRESVRSTLRFVDVVPKREIGAGYCI